MIYSPWFIELALEILGAMLYFRRNRLLCGLFAFLAASDIALVFIYQLARQTAYGWAYWGQRSGKYFLLICLACSICGMFVAERDRQSKIASTAFMSLATFAMATVAFMQGNTLKDSLLAAEIATNVVLAACIAVAWIGRRGMLSAECKTVTAGFVLMIAADVLFTVLWLKWDGARHWYWTGAILAYGVWVAGPMRKVRLGEFRSSIGQKFAEVQKVQVM